MPKKKSSSYFKKRSEQAKKQGKSRKMTPAEKARAKRYAKKAGRTKVAYVDRLRAMKKK